MTTVIPLLGLIGFLLAGGCTEAQGWSSRMGQVGWASWYGKCHHGRPTASGECFSMYRLTAAHRTLPLGTTVVVTNLQTRQQVVVRMTDRGPYVEPRGALPLMCHGVSKMEMTDEGGCPHCRA